MNCWKCVCMAASDFPKYHVITFNKHPQTQSPHHTHNDAIKTAIDRSLSVCLSLSLSLSLRSIDLWWCHTHTARGMTFDLAYDPLVVCGYMLQSRRHSDGRQHALGCDLQLTHVQAFDLIIG